VHDIAAGSVFHSKYFFLSYFFFAFIAVNGGLERIEESVIILKGTFLNASGRKKLLVETFLNASGRKKLLVETFLNSSGRFCTTHPCWRVLAALAARAFAAPQPRIIIQVTENIRLQARASRDISQYEMSSHTRAVCQNISTRDAEGRRTLRKTKKEHKRISALSWKSCNSLNKDM
jgi:hypothetical protein